MVMRIIIKKMNSLSLKECDLVMSAVVMTIKRFQIADFVHPWFSDSVVLVIPNPFLSTNIGAIWQPFRFEVCLAIHLANQNKQPLTDLFAEKVWILVVLSPVVIIFVLRCFNNGTRNTKDEPWSKNIFRQPFNYVIRTLLSQGKKQ